MKSDVTLEGSSVADALGFPEDGKIFPVRNFRFSVSPAEHPLYTAHRADIEENWEREVAANPSLYNGELVFQHSLSLAGDVLAGEGHLVPYSTHLWWRKQTDRRGGIHAFAWAVPVSSDGALIAIRMGAKTANPGLVYCAAGSFEKPDIVDGCVDVVANMRRELLEETGLDAQRSTRPDGYYGIVIDNALLLFRVHRFDMTAEEMLARIRHHMQHDHEQEIEEAIAIRDPDPKAHRYSQFMAPLLRMVL